MKCFVLILLLLLLTEVVPENLDNLLNLACDGNLPIVLKKCASIETAECTFIRASLELILNSNGTKAVALHRTAKLMSSGVIPPLAKLHLDGRTCGGLGDLFYVTAVVTKELVDSEVDSRKLLNGLTTLITLIADSGLHNAAEKHVVHATELATELDKDVLHALLFRSALMTPGVFESSRHISKTRALLESRVNHLLVSGQTDPSSISLKSLDEFVMSPTFYFIYQGRNDKDILSQLHSAYSIAYPALSTHTDFSNAIANRVYHHQQENSIRESRKIRVGFVSSYFRRHSICKLFCGIMTGLAESSSVLEVFAFSSLQESHEDQLTQTLKTSLGRNRFITLGKTLIQNRREVTDRAIDILVYLDVGMEPSTTVWAAARLAPIQVCVWGHPSTSGMLHMDYYVSSELFHTWHHYPTAAAAAQEGPRGRNTTAQDFFTEQLVQLDALGFSFQRPSLGAGVAVTTSVSVGMEGGSSEGDAVSSAMVQRDHLYYEQLLSNLTGQTAGAEAVRDLIREKMYSGKKLVLCTQHLPKFHPDFDHILGQVLIRDSDAMIVLIDNANKHQWRRTLEARWRKSFTREVNSVLTSSSLDELIALSGLHGRKLSGDSPLLNNSTETIDALLDRIVWLPSLTPQEYLSVMAAGEVMLDPFPFGGGVTALEALAVCTPVVTLPLRQNVPSLAAGMLLELQLSRAVEDLLIVSEASSYVKSVLSLTKGDDAAVVEVRSEVCRSSDRIFSTRSSVMEWDRFLVNAADNIVD